MKYLSTLLLLAAPLAAEKAPNFIIIYMDDLGWAQTSVRMMGAARANSVS